MEIVDGDYDGLVLIMMKLTGIKERQADTDKMFEPLKDAMVLLKVGRLWNGWGGRGLGHYSGVVKKRSIFKSLFSTARQIKTV
jgi:hypothetical protein